MFGKSKLGDSVAADMDRILGDSEFQSVFSKPELTDDYSQALAGDAKYKAFVRIASKHADHDCGCADDDDECECDEADDDKADADDRIPEWLEKKREDAASKEAGEPVDIYEGGYDPSKKKDAALALEFMVENLNKYSEALDNMGLEKSATVTMALINGIFKEASIKLAQNSSPDTTGEMEGRVKELHEALTSGDVVEDEMGGEGETIDDEVNPQGDDPVVGDAVTEAEGGETFTDEVDGDQAYMMATAAADKKDKEKMATAKKCVAECKKLLKKHGCKGTVKLDGDTVVVHCKGDKKDCMACKKECMALCKKHKVKCKCHMEVDVKKKASGLKALGQHMNHVNSKVRDFKTYLRVLEALGDAPLLRRAYNAYVLGQKDAFDTPPNRDQIESQLSAADKIADVYSRKFDMMRKDAGLPTYDSFKENLMAIMQGYDSKKTASSVITDKKVIAALQNLNDWLDS